MRFEKMFQVNIYKIFQVKQILIKIKNFVYMGFLTIFYIALH